MLIAVLVGCQSSGVSNVQIAVVDTSEDRTSTQGVFSPGPGFDGKLRNDFRWRLSFVVDSPKIIEEVFIQQPTGCTPDGWTTSSAKFRGRDLYPIVVFRNGEQLNHHYDQRIGPLLPGSHILDLYGQMETMNFKGGSITIRFEGGEVVRARISADNVPVVPLPLALTCSDTDGGANYGTPGRIIYTVGDGARYTYSDKCIDHTRVAEGLCGGVDLQGRQFVISHGPCEQGCYDGRCR